MKKKFLLLGIAMLFSLAFLVACGNGDDSGTAADVGNEEVTEPADNGDDNGYEDEDEEETRPVFDENDFVIWMDNEEFADAIIPALEAEFPGVTFQWHQMGNVDSMDALALDGPAGIGPDIIFFPHDRIHRGINDQLLLPLGPDISAWMEGRFHDAAVASAYDASSNFHFGIPMATESVALFYNRDILNSFGFEPATTFEELIEQVEYMNAADGGLHFRINPDNAYDMHFVTTAHGFQLFGPDHNDPDQANFDTPEVIAGLTWFRELRERILDIPNADLDDANRQGAFIDGEVAYLVTGPWHIADITNDGDFEFGVVKFPTINGVQPISFSGNIMMAGSAFRASVPGRPDLIREVLQFLASDAGLQIQYDVRGTIPALIDGSVIDGLADNPHHMGILAQANYSHPMPIIPEMSHFWSVAGSMYGSVWDGILTPEEAAEHAQLGYDSERALAAQ